MHRPARQHGGNERKKEEEKEEQTTQGDSQSPKLRAPTKPRTPPIAHFGPPVVRRRDGGYGAGHPAQDASFWAFCCWAPALTILRSSYSLVNSRLRMPRSLTRSWQAVINASFGVRVPSVWIRSSNFGIKG